jgi:hypothetical protein
MTRAILLSLAIIVMASTSANAFCAYDDYACQNLEAEQREAALERQREMQRQAAAEARRRAAARRDSAERDYQRDWR